jgi:phage terminase small subunit
MARPRNKKPSADTVLVPVAAVPTKRRRRKNTKEEMARYRAFAVAYQAVGQPTYMNGYKSALTAGYTESTASAIGGSLVHRPKIQQLMRKIRDARIAASTIATPEEVLETLTSQSRALPDGLVDAKGEFKPLNELDKSVLHSIIGVKKRSRTTTSKSGESVTETTWEYKLADRTRAAEILAKHHGLFEKDNAQQKADATNISFVMMPTGEIPLDDWNRQAQIVLKQMDDKKKALPHIIDITPTSPSEPAPQESNFDFLDIGNPASDDTEKE